MYEQFYTTAFFFFFKFFPFLSNFIYLLAVLHGLWDPGLPNGCQTHVPCGGAQVLTTDQQEVPSQ